MVAHTDGKERRDGDTVQRVLGAVNRNPLSLLPQAEQGENPFFPGGEGEGTIAEGSEEIAFSVEIARCPRLGQKPQGLKVGQGVIRTAAGTAVKVECAVSLFQAVFNGQHCVGVVLFHREGVNGNPLGEVIQRVEIAQQQVGLQPGGLTVAVTSVSGENNIPWGWGDWQTKERAGTKDQSGGRRHKNQLFSKGFLGMVPSYHVLPALTRGEFFVRLNRQNFSMGRAE